jgi:hypothetical protein
MVEYKKEKEKELVYPWQEAIYIYLWVIGMLYYKEGHNGTVEGFRSAQTPCKTFYSLLCLLGWTFSSGHRGMAALPGQTYLTPGLIYLTSRIYPATIGFQNCGSYPGRTYPTPGWIYSTHQIYPVFIGFQYHVTLLDRIYPSPIRYIQPSQSWANLNSPSDISDLGRIYPMFWCLQ